jgi:hypothetical protein
VLVQSPGGMGKESGTMIDNFSLALSHGLMLLAAWLLLRRPDLDREASAADEDAGPRRGKRFGA